MKTHMEWLPTLLRAAAIEIVSTRKYHFNIFGVSEFYFEIHNKSSNWAQSKISLYLSLKGSLMEASLSNRFCCVAVKSGNWLTFHILILLSNRMILQRVEILEPHCSVFNIFLFGDTSLQPNNFMFSHSNDWTFFQKESVNKMMCWSHSAIIWRINCENLFTSWAFAGKFVRIAWVHLGIFIFIFIFNTSLYCVRCVILS